MFERSLIGSGATRLAALMTAVSLLMPGAQVVAQQGSSVLPHHVNVGPQAVLATRGPGAAHFSCQTTGLCYSPQQIRMAYDIQPLLDAGTTGAGRTIVIVDAYSNPYIQQDLSIFDQTFGLPDPPSFQVIAPQGVPTFDFTDPNMVGWSSEISLDVQWAHAIAPAAAIKLVEATSSNDIDIYNATKWAIDNNVGDVFSQSFGEGEACLAPDPNVNGMTFAAAEHVMFQQAVNKGMTLFASSGDNGAAQPDCVTGGAPFFLSASTPASDTLVTAVGGTRLTADTVTGAYGSETAWNDSFGASGGGFSVLFKRPPYQAPIKGTQPKAKGVPDVAYNAGVNGGVLAHWGVGLEVLRGIPPTDPRFPLTFFRFGGTSAGSPQWAGLVALADQMAGHRLGSINDTLYKIKSQQGRGLYSQAFHDITSGNNVFPGVGGYNTAIGWDPVTGLGTPVANVLVPLLAGRGH
jgi:subtilase family serine protease